MNLLCLHTPSTGTDRRLPVMLNIILFLVFWGFTGHPVHAGTPLTWEDCVREALTRHPDLLSAREQLNQALAAKDIAASPALPQFSAGMSGDRSDRDEQPGTTSYGYSISGRQLLYDGSKTAHQVAAARSAISSEQYTYDVASSRVRLQLRMAFVNLLQARELLAITTEIAKRRQQNLGLVQLRYEAGREHKGSLLSAKANVAQAEYEIQSSKRALELAKWRLAKELGRDGNKDISITGKMDVPKIDPERPHFDKLARENPFLKELIVQKDIALSGKETVKSDFFPQVFADASVGRSDSDWPPARDQWSVGVSLSLPLFEGGSRFASLRKAAARLRQSEAQEKNGYLETIDTLFSTWTDLQNAVDRVTVGNAFVTASEERARISQVEYSNGLISFDNWSIIEDDLERDRKTSLAYLTNALIAHAYWIQAKGETLEYDLEKK